MSRLITAVIFAVFFAGVAFLGMSWTQMSQTYTLGACAIGGLAGALCGYLLGGNRDKE